MMRIERIRGSHLKGLGDVDWLFPAGPSFLIFEEKGQPKAPGRLLQELLYHQNNQENLKLENKAGLLEVWVTGDNTRFHIRQEFIQEGNFRKFSTQIKEEMTGQNLSLPQYLTLGDYLFRLNQQAFHQGAVIEWPEVNDRDQFRQRINNLRQCGDERTSPVRSQASLSGAQKKVSEQKGSMALVKAEYDELRLEWEASHRQQDEDRLLLIDIKKLQETEAILSERIQSTKVIQERLAILSQNPDYRELRQLQAELIQLKEQLQAAESNLATLTKVSDMDWVLLDTLREECNVWARVQEQVEHFANIAQIQAEKLSQLQASIQRCGYEGSSDAEDQRLRRVMEERDLAQEELNKLIIKKADLDSTKLIYSKEVARLREFVDIARVTEADEVKITQWESRLKKWQNSNFGCSLDRKVQKYFNGASIGEKLASRLDQYFKKYQVLDIEEFKSRLQEFHNQKKLVEGIWMQIEQWQNDLVQEDILVKTVESRTELLNQSFRRVHVEDFSAWLKGWEDYQRKKQLLSITTGKLTSLLERSTIEEEKLRALTEQLRERLVDWDTPSKDRDGIFALVVKAAKELRFKDEAERKIAECSQRYKDILGDRDMDSLATILEPLAELEQEARVSKDDRMSMLTAWEKERLEIRKQRMEAEKRLQSSRRYPSLTILEERIETVKREWMAYEGLQRAITDAHLLLEMSIKEWQAKFRKALNHEVEWILSKFDSSKDSGTIQSDLDLVKCHYFAYRMANAQLAIGSYPEVPLLLSVGEINEGERFWDDVIEFLSKLSFTRQIIFTTTDLKLEGKLKDVGWSSCRWG